MKMEKKMSLNTYLLSITFLLLTACGGGSSSNDDNNNQPPTPTIDICDEDPDTFFANRVFPILQTRCMTCHVDGGSAPANGARWIVHASAANTQSDIDSLIGIEGFQYLLDKPSGAVSHGGGVALPSNSDNFEIYSQYIQFKGVDGFCD